MNNIEYLWCEKYRPKKVEDCVLTDELKNTFLDIVKKGEIPNMLLSGPPGLGKTTVAKAICNELDTDYLFINASSESGIDVLRTTIKQFASSVSLSGNDKAKCVILDEADYLNPNSFQPALRGMIEEFSKNCRFILTCNFKNRVISPLHSRCQNINFAISKKDMPVLAGSFMKRLQMILDIESIEYEKKVLAELIMKFMPDWRRVIMECQRYSSSGKIDSGILSNVASANIDNLLACLKKKDWKGMREWVANNSDSDQTEIYNSLYNSLNDYIVTSKIPEIVLVIADYMYKSAFVASGEINLVACLTEIMSEAEFK